MLKKLNYIHLALEIVNFSVILIVMIISGYDSPNLFITALVCLLLVFPILNLLFVLIKEAKILEYNSSKMFSTCMSSMVLLGCLIWYLFFHLEFNYLQTLGLWYGCLLLAFALPILVCDIIGRKKDKNSNGPKFIQNGR